MTSSRHKFIALAAVAAVLAATVDHSAGSLTIGINFVGNENNSQSVMAPTEIAGVVAQGHWNNAVSGCGALSSLLDNSGAPTSVGAEWRARGDYLAIMNDPGDNRLMRGCITQLGPDPATVTVSGLGPLCQVGWYDLLVYFDGRNGAADWTGDYTVGGATLIGTDPAGTDFDGRFILDTGSGGNYLRFEHLACDAFTLQAVSATGVGSIAINALQIIHTPEPATLALLGFGLAAALRRRRQT